MIQQCIFHFWVHAHKTRKQGLYTQIQSSIIQNNQKVETTQVSIGGWMGECCNSTYTYEALLTVVKFTETEDRMVGAGPGRRGEWGVVV